MKANRNRFFARYGTAFRFQPSERPSASTYVCLGDNTSITSALHTSGGLEEDLVVEAESQLGHAGQEDSHLDAADDLAPQHRPVRVRLPTLLFFYSSRPVSRHDHGL